MSDCDGLPVMVEVLLEPRVRSILAARDRSRRAGLEGTLAYEIYGDAEPS